MKTTPTPRPQERIVWAAGREGSKTYHLLGPSGTLPFVCAAQANKQVVAQTRTDWLPPRFAFSCPRCTEWQNSHS